jgi:signal transduction histidine kinase
VLRSKAFLERDRIYSTKGEYRKALREMQYYYNKVKDSEVLSELAAALNYVTGKFMLLNMNVSSLIYLQKNLEVQRQQGYPIGIGSVLENIATVYKNQLSLAFGYLENASEYYKSQNYSLGLAQLSINRSEIFFIQKREKKVIQMLTGAVVYSSEKEDYYSLRAQYDALAAAYDLAGNTNGASRAPKNFHAINDGLISIVKQRAISEPLAKYETKEKKQQLALQKAQLGVQELKIGQNRLLIIGLVLIALLLIVVMLLVRQLSKKKEQLLFQKAQLKLREAELNAVINAQEKERHRFARELHNGFGQLISVLKLNLSMLTEKDAQYPEKRMEVFKNGESVINDMYAELRSICFDLMPQTLIKKGLTLALKEFGDRINQSKKMSCEVIVFSNQERLSEIIEISLFRISQEWVNNILKYSESEYITIHLTRDEGAITLTIENDGKGFDSQQFFESKGNGWRNIQTRLNLIKGGIDLDTHPEREGTMITVNVSNEAQKRIPTSTVRQIRG